MTDEPKHTLLWSAERLVEHIVTEASEELEKHSQAQTRLARIRARASEAAKAEVRLGQELAGYNDQLMELLAAGTRDESAIQTTHREITRIESELGQAAREAKLTRGSDGETLKQAEKAAQVAQISARQRIEKSLRRLASHRGDELLRAIAAVFQKYLHAAHAIEQAHSTIHREHDVIFGADVALLPTLRGTSQERSICQDIELAIQEDSGIRFLVSRYFPADGCAISSEKSTCDQLITSVPGKAQEHVGKALTPTAPETDAEPDEPQELDPGASICTGLTAIQ